MLLKCGILNTHGREKPDVQPALTLAGEYYRNFFPEIYNEVTTEYKKPFGYEAAFLKRTAAVPHRFYGKNKLPGLEDDYLAFAREFADFYPIESKQTEYIPMRSALDHNKSAGIWYHSAAHKAEILLFQEHKHREIEEKLLDLGWQTVNHPDCPYLPNLVNSKTNEVIATRVDKVRLVTNVSAIQIIHDKMLNQYANDDMALKSQFGRIPIFVGQTLFHGYGTALISRLKKAYTYVLDLSGEEYSFNKTTVSAIGEVRKQWTLNTATADGAKPLSKEAADHIEQLTRYYRLKHQVPFVHGITGVIYTKPDWQGVLEDSGGNSTYHDNSIHTLLGALYSLARMLGPEFYRTLTPAQLEAKQHLKKTPARFNGRLTLLELNRLFFKERYPENVYSLGDDINLNFTEVQNQIFNKNGGLDELFRLALETGHQFTFEQYGTIVLAKISVNPFGKMTNVEPKKQIAKIIYTDAEPALLYQQLCGAEINLHNTKYALSIREFIKFLCRHYNFPLPHHSKAELDELYQ